MKLLSLNLQNFRNLVPLNITLHSYFNVFFGDNGAGKTSVLEAIYYLGMGRSFRCKHADHIIQHMIDSFFVTAVIKHADQQLTTNLGLERQREGVTRMRLNENDVRSRAEFAKQLPVLLINSDSYKLLESGPAHRRSFMNAGLFHVEHLFHDCWKRMNKSLQQRNAGLKQRIGRDQLALWTDEFCMAANEMHGYRKQYVEKLTQVFQEVLSEIFPIDGLSLRYYPGWDDSNELRQLIDDNIALDYKVGFTSHGPHKADLIFEINGVPAVNVLSRGQQKLFVYALGLAQGKLMHAERGFGSVYLIDDLPSELDAEKTSHLLNALRGIDSQVFLTGVYAADFSKFLDQEHTKMFHVKHGEVTEEVI